MKMFLISDSADTLAGFRLVGVDGRLSRTHEEALANLTEALNDSEVGILLIMEHLAARFADIISDAKLNRPLPLIVEIPGIGSKRRSDFIESYIKEAIGVKL